MKLSVLSALNAARNARRPAILISNLQDGAQRLVEARDVESDPLAPLLTRALAMGKSAAVDHEGVSYFLGVHAPPPRLYIVGAVHIAQALAPMARAVDFDVAVIDPREAFAAPQRFASAKILAQWPDEAFASLGLDRYTAVAALTHDPKIDDGAIKIALQSQCFYVGALGSRKTHARRLERLSAEGFSQSQLARIHAPIGLDIAAVSPAEIAVSILAQLILSLRKKPLRADAAA